jgi:hypothetical protein
MNELDILKNRIDVFYSYIESSPESYDPIMKVHEEHMKKPVDIAFVNKDIKYLRRWNKELNTWFVEMRPDEKEFVAKMFMERLGEDIYKTDSKRIRKIETIKKRGIKTKAEYVLLNERVGEIFQDDNMQSEVELLNNLMLDFHKR